MATEPTFVENIVDQTGLEGRFVCRKMFGEYGFHLDGKFIAEPYPVADELLEDPALLTRVLLATAKLLPAPKPKKRKVGKS